MGDHAGSDALGSFEGNAIEDSGGGGDEGESPVGEGSVAEVDAAEDGGGEDESGGWVAEEAGEHGLEEASEEELLAKGDDPEETEEGGGDLEGQFPPDGQSGAKVGELDGVGEGCAEG